MSAIVPGAGEIKNPDEVAKWLPTLEAFEAGAWLLWVDDKSVKYVPVPKLSLEAGRLHREDGPAFVSLDLELWYLSGVQVDEQIVLRPQSQTLSQISSEENAEIKRVRIERYGWERYLRGKRAQVIEHVRNDITQTDESLMRCDDMTVLVCACPSTARTYSLEVPAECSTVEQAQNFLSGGRARRIVLAT